MPKEYDTGLDFFEPNVNVEDDYLIRMVCSAPFFPNYENKQCKYAFAYEKLIAHAKNELIKIVNESVEYV